MVQLYFAKHWIWKTGAIIMFLIFLLMIIYQIITKQSIFVPDIGEGIVTAPSAHIAGAISGIACTLIYNFIKKQ
jgi:hypothetical protein